MLELRDVTVGYGDPARAPAVLSGLQVRLAPGERLGLLGPSGSGKTTIIRLLTFQLPLWSGEYLVDAQPVNGTGWAVSAEVRRKVGLMLQSPRAAADPRMRLRAAITEPLRTLPRVDRPGPALAERRLAQAIAQAAFASELLERLPAEVSEGQLARAMLARAIIAEPRYLVCDEPTASVDSATAQTVRRTLTEIAASGVGVLVVSHHETELVNWADRVLRLGHGAVTQADR